MNSEDRQESGKLFTAITSDIAYFFLRNYRKRLFQQSNIYQNYLHYIKENPSRKVELAYQKSTPTDEQELINLFKEISGEEDPNEKCFNKYHMNLIELMIDENLFDIFENLKYICSEKSLLDILENLKSIYTDQKYKLYAENSIKYIEHKNFCYTHHEHEFDANIFLPVYSQYSILLDKINSNIDTLFKKLTEAGLLKDNKLNENKIDAMLDEKQNILKGKGNILSELRTNILYLNKIIELEKIILEENININHKRFIYEKNKNIFDLYFILSTNPTIENKLVNITELKNIVELHNTKTNCLDRILKSVNLYNESNAEIFEYNQDYILNNIKSRIIGLYLYDKIDITNKNKTIKTVPIEMIRTDEILQKYGFSDLIIDPDKNNVGQHTKGAAASKIKLNNYLKSTRNCIEYGMILPIKAL